MVRALSCTTVFFLVVISQLTILFLFHLQSEANVRYIGLARLKDGLLLASQKGRKVPSPSKVWKLS